VSSTVCRTNAAHAVSPRVVGLKGNQKEKKRGKGPCKESVLQASFVTIPFAGSIPRFWVGGKREKEKKRMKEKIEICNSFRRTRKT